MKPWTNQNVLFLHSDVDDSGLGRWSRRILLHLRRRLGKTGKKNPGVRSMARVCRMDEHTIERELGALEGGGYIEIHRSAGKLNRYKLLINPSKLYIDHRLDDLGLSVVQVCVLAHMSRLADEAGMFFINESEFARVCGMKRETVHSALEELEAMGFYDPYDTRNNPRYFLSLSDLFPREEKLPDLTNGVPTAEGNNCTSTADMPERTNSLPDLTNGVGPKEPTALPDLTNVRVSIEINPLKTIQVEDNPAPSASPTDADECVAVASSLKKPEEPVQLQDLIKQLTSECDGLPDEDFTARLKQEDRFNGIDMPARLQELKKSKLYKPTSSDRERFVRSLFAQTASISTECRT